MFSKEHYESKFKPFEVPKEDEHLCPASLWDDEEEDDDFYEGPYTEYWNKYRKVVVGHFYKAEFKGYLIEVDK